MGKIDILIIDDEKSARENLRSKISQFSEDFNVKGEAQNIVEAKALILESKPDAIFLDISMPNGTGFDLLNDLEKIDFDVVFVTAYNRYAVQAFKYFAIGYVLKPIELSELHSVLQHLIEKHGNGDNQNVEKLVQYMKTDQNVPILAIPVEYGFEFVETEQIIYLEASNGYAKIYMKDESFILSSKSLSYYTGLLDKQLFSQIHRSFIINLSCLKKYHNIGFVTLENGVEIQVAKSKRSQFKNMFR